MPTVIKQSQSSVNWFVTQVSRNLNAGGGSSTQTSKGSYGTTKYVTKDITPRNWKQLIRDGYNATTGLTAQITDRTLAFGGASGTTVWHANPLLFAWYYSLNGNLVGDIGSPSITGLTLTSATNLSLQQFYQRLAATESKFKGLTFGGELKQTLKMLKSPFSSLRAEVGRYLSSVQKRTKRTKAAHRLKMVGDTWLEHSFGWRPLISDCDDAVDAFFDSKAIRPIHEMVRGFARESSTTQLYNNIQVLSLGPISVRARGGDEFQVEVKHYGTYTSRGDGLPNLHHYGFSPWEFVPTLWELVPWSFLVDYFTNVGAILESWSYRQIGANFVARTTVRRALRVVSGNVPGAISGSGYSNSASGSGGESTCSVLNITREPNAANPLPSLMLKVPGSWSQWANIGALGLQHKRTVNAVRGF